MLEQPATRVQSVFLVPVSGRTQPETVSPEVHIRQHANRADRRADFRDGDLQIADRYLLHIVATGIGVQPRPSHRRHAHPVGQLVEKGVDGRIGHIVQAVDRKSGFRCTPVRSGNRISPIGRIHLQPVSLRRIREHVGCQVTAAQHTDRYAGSFRNHGSEASRLMTSPTRSRARFSRISASSAALPRTSRSSYV